MTFGGFNHRLRRLIIALTAEVRARAVLVVVVSGVLTALSLAVLLTRFAVNSDTSEMLSPDLPFLVHSRAEKHIFPQYRDVLVVVIEAPSDVQAERAGQTLAQALRARPELFGEVFYPQGDPFFRRNGLLYLPVEELKVLGERLIAGQPFIGAVSSDPSLRGLFHVLGLAVSEGAGERADELAQMLAAVAETVEAVNDGRTPVFSLRALSGAGPAAGLDQRRQIVVVRPRLDFASTRPAAEAMETVRRLFDDLRLAQTFGASLALTGDAALDTEELTTVETGTTLATVLSLSLVLVLLWLCFHSARLIAIVLTTVIVGLLWTCAFATAVVGPFNIISVTFAVLYIGLSADFSIHYALRYVQAITGGASQSQAWRQTARDIGGPLALSAVAAAIGFAAFLPTEYRGLAELGLIASAGMFIALVINLILLPALVTLFAPSSIPVFSGVIRRLAGRFSRWVTSHDRAILVAAAGLMLASLAVSPSLTFDADPLNLKSQDSEAVSTLLALRRDGWDNRYVISGVAPSLEQALTLAERLRTLPTVGEVRTILDFVPADQERKRAIIDDVALILEPAWMGSPVPPPGPEQTIEAIATFRATLSAAAARPDAAAAAAGRLAAALARVPTDEAGAPWRQRLQDALIGSLEGELTTIRTIISPQVVTLADLPAAVRERWLAADGRARIEVFPKNDIRGDSHALRAFVEGVAGILPTATGEPALILGARDTILAAFFTAAAISVIAIGLILGLVLHRAVDSAFVFAPILWAAVVAVGAAVVVGIPFNLANIIALPLLFGLGVAGSVQFVIRTRTEQGTKEALNSSTPRAVLFSFLTTISSFGSLAIVDHPGIATMGLLLTLALAIALISTLVVLPALMHRFGRFQPG